MPIATGIIESHFACRFIKESRSVQHEDSYLHCCCS